MAEKLIKKQIFSWLITLSLMGLVFTAPSNLFFKFDQLNWAIRGLRIDYLLPKIYLSDLAALTSLVMLLIWREQTHIKTNQIKNIWQNLGWAKVLVVLVGGSFFVRQLLSLFPATALASSLRLGLMFGLWWLTKKYWSQLNHKPIWWSLIFTHIFQSCLAIGQFFSQKSLGEYYWLLGETNLNNSYGIAHGNFGIWGEKILPYGTTAHPNILAGWIVGSWLLAVYWAKLPKFEQNWLAKLMLIVTGWLTLDVVFLTESWSAAVMLIIGLGWLFFKSQKFIVKKFINWRSLMIVIGAIMLSPWWLNLINSQLKFSTLTHDALGWERRVWLTDAATKIWAKYALTGVGLNQFTAYLETVNPSKELVRFVQPTHHVGWLWLSETGLMGLLLVGLAIYLNCHKNPKQLTAVLTWLIIVTPIMIWDHYLLTHPTGLWLSWWWLTYHLES